MKKYILSFAIIIIFFCTYFSFNKEKIVLSRFNSLQWNLYKSNSKNKILSNYNKYNLNSNFHKVGVYEFFWNGECEYYLHDYKKNKLFKYQANDIEVSNKWEYINDSTFDINGYKYKILYFKKDSIALLWNNPNWLDTLILVPSPVHIEVAKR
jgi:hypothetical protein